MNRTLILDALIYSQGNILTYQTSANFKDIAMLFSKNTRFSSAHIKKYMVIRENYIKKERVHELKNHIQQNLNTVFLPPLIISTTKNLLIHSIQQPEAQEVINNPKLLLNYLRENPNSLNGEIQLDLESHPLYLLKGCHVATAISEVYKVMGEATNNLKIGITIYVEKDESKLVKDFIFLNSSHMVDKSLKYIHVETNPLNEAVKMIAGLSEEQRFILRALQKDNPDYIGFDSASLSATRNSPSVITFNMLKQMLLYFSLGEDATEKKFTEVFTVGSPFFLTILELFKEYISIFFSTSEAFSKIRKYGTSYIPSLRKDYANLSGAGLYLISLLGYEARKITIPMKVAGERVGLLDWRRKLSNGNINPLLLDGILDSKGKVINTKASITTNKNTLLVKLNWS